MAASSFCNAKKKKKEKEMSHNEIHKSHTYIIQLTKSQ